MARGIVFYQKVVSFSIRSRLTTGVTNLLLFWESYFLANFMCVYKMAVLRVTFSFGHAIFVIDGDKISKEH